MQERIVEKHIRKHLIKKGWKIINPPKLKGEHGVDILARNPIWMKTLYIEIKGGGGKHKNQELHNAFYNIFGQILSRMDIGGNHPKRGRIYAIGIPYSWRRVFKNKINKMKYGWKLLKLRVLLVKANGQVVELPYTKMLY